LLQNAYDITNLPLGMLLHHLGKLKIQFSADIQQIGNKMQTNCIFCAPIFIRVRVTVYAECIYVFYQNLVLVAEYHVDR